MAGRHRARRTRSLPALPALPSLPPLSSLKAPAAAGATVAAMGAVAALGIGLSGGEDPDRAQMAAHSASTTSEPPSSTTSAKPKKTTATKKAAKKQAKNQAVATIKAKPKPAKPAAQACSTALDGTQPPVAQVGNHVLEQFDVDSVGGQASRGGTSDHPSGLAIDFMVDTETGNALADYMLAHQDEFEVTYVIWQQRYNDGSGWSMMEDRGSPTANHYDHVHVSFSGAPVSVTC